MLIHIGYHKTGSTWLQKSLFTEANGFCQPLSQDELTEFLVNPSDLDFISEDFKRKLGSRHAELGATGALVLSHERFSGDPWTGARDAKSIAHRFQNTFPTAKVLIVIREPKSYLASLYKTYLILGGSARLKEFLFPPQDEQNQWFSPDICRFDVLIEEYCKLFGRANVLVLDFDDLCSDQRAFAEEIRRFCELNNQLTLGGKENESVTDFTAMLFRYFNVIFASFSAYPLMARRFWLWRKLRSLAYFIDGDIGWLKKRKIFRRRIDQIFKSDFDESYQKSRTYIYDHDFKKD